MGLNFSNCEIRTPAGKELLRLYDMLAEVFPVDRPIFEAMRETGKRFYTWTPYVLYRGDEVLGNVSLVPMRIRLGGRPVEVVGIASVATPDRYRRMGVAGHLMRHCLYLVDKLKRPAVLFTDLPAVYEGMGFRVIPQTYRTTSPRSMDFDEQGGDHRLLDTIPQRDLEQMARIFERDYPKYDGTVDRDAEYWQLYQMLCNLSAKSNVLIGLREQEFRGYTRFEVEDDRLLVSEICTDESAPEVAEGLLHQVVKHALGIGRERLTFALPADHFAWRILEGRNVRLGPEPPGAHREVFMARPAAGEDLGALARLQWSLADKF